MSAHKPSSKETSGLNLPPPVGGAGEKLPAELSEPLATEAGPEAAIPGLAGPERAPSSAAAGAAAALPAMPLSLASDNSATPPKMPKNDVSSTSKSAAGGLIKDDDLIEKEWVDKAKRIVERTREDPHQQSEQLTSVKADYMKQRYDKTIKISK